MISYNPHKIEKKWQEVWEKEKTFKARESSKKPKYYQLETFPYPSAVGLHVGHPKGYIAEDIHARFMRMKELEVLYTMGWDAFGLPTENYAIKVNKSPKEVAKDNIKNFKRQLKMIGLSYDWDREINTSSPEYYKWTQWLFIQLFKKGLAYRAKAKVNWCPGCQTVLANEQVIAGKCERCDSKVVQKDLEQWFFKITKYRDSLIGDLRDLDWPASTIKQQKDWIGRSEGSELEFSISGSQFLIKTFTTRPDTLFGATYMVLAPEHEIIKNLESRIKNLEEVNKYIEEAGGKTDLERMTGVKEKTGVEIKGVKAINPASKEEIPIFIADYVLASYGTGAIMAVPAHDERDFEFAKKFGLKVIEVIKGGDLPYIGEGEMVNSGKFDGLSSQDARDEIIKFVKGEKKVQYKIRDWLISRQRYWGAPIPIIYCEKCGAQPVPEKDLPVILPTDVDFKPKGKSPLERSVSFHKVKCPKCSRDARRESDTMDTFVDSSWYYFRYTDSGNQEEFASRDNLKCWMPISLYIIGAEHTVLHLLYSRFITKFLHEEGYIGFREPFLKLRHQGMILGPDGQRMSKSKGNVINPDDVIEEFGADTFRMYEMFMGPFEDSSPWNTKSIIGIFRFLTKVWNLGGELVALSEKEKIHESKVLRGDVHRTTQKVENDITGFSFNTAISSLMILLAKIEKEKSLPAFRTFLLLLYPFAPHLASELWQKLEYGKYVWEESWPEVIDKYLQQEEITLIVQVNGKVRDTILLPTGLTKVELKKVAEKSANVSRHLKGKKIKNVVVVPDRLVNFVTE